MFSRAEETILRTLIQRVSQVAALPINLASGVSGVLPIANGGTAKALTLVAGNIIYCDADSFEVSSDINIATNGEVTMARQPSFVAKKSAAQNNITGQGERVTCTYGTEIADRGGDYNVDGTFTAAVPGLYRFSASVEVANLTAATAVYEQAFESSNRRYTVNSITAGSETGAVLNGCVLADMDAGDTMVVQFPVFAMATTTANYGVDASKGNFSGELVV